MNKKKTILIVISIWLLINLPISYFTIFSISNINNFDNCIFIKAVIFSIIATTPAIWAITKKNKGNN